MGRRRETSQTTSTSSSSASVASGHRENAGYDHIQKTVGCMTGLFHFFSRHHQSHSRKRLTSAKKEKIVLPPPKPSPLPEKTHPASGTIDNAMNKKRTDSRRKSCETPRSPTIPPEIRRRSSSSSVESPGHQRGLVARLMGLEDLSPSSDTSPPESAAEKRRKLLGALEKCDEDLRTLRRIIEAVHLAEVKTKAVVSAVDSTQRAESGVRKQAKAVEFGGGEQPSPVSVFDAISSPRYRSKRHDNEKAGGSEILAVGSKIVKPSRMGILFSGENCKKSRKWDGDQMDERLGTVCRKGPDVDGMPSPPPRAYELKELIARRLTAEGCMRQRQWWWQTKRSLSQAMVENVSEVWADGVWEERWEMGRVAVALAGEVLWDLVEEAVADLIACCSQLSFGRRRACRKRLYF